MDDSRINDRRDGDVSKLGRTGMGRTMGTSFSMRSTTGFSNPEKKKKKRMILKRIIE